MLFYKVMRGTAPLQSCLATVLAKPPRWTNAARLTFFNSEWLAKPPSAPTSPIGIAPCRPAHGFGKTI